MCMKLSVWNKRRLFHEDLTDKYKPTKLIRDKVVYKILFKEKHPNGLVNTSTPFQGKTVVFDDEKCTFEEIPNDLFSFYDVELVVNFDIFCKEKHSLKARKYRDGYHSYTSFREAKRTLLYLNGHCSPNSNTIHHIHKAIIPKGSYVYYGKSHEIVSNKLTIYKKPII